MANGDRGLEWGFHYQYLIMVVLLVTLYICTYQSSSASDNKCPCYEYVLAMLPEHALSLYADLVRVLGSEVAEVFHTAPLSFMVLAGVCESRSS